MTAEAFFALFFAQLCVVCTLLAVFMTPDGWGRAVLYGLFVVSAIGAALNAWRACEQFQPKPTESTDA